MVEINNQRKAFLDMLAWFEELITDVRTRNHGYDVIVGGELFTDYSDHPRKLVTLNPKTQINRRRTLPASSPVGGMPTASSWPERLSESQDAGIAADYERGALPMIDRGDIRQAIDRCSTSGLHCRALVMVSSSIRLTAWLQIQRSGRNGQRCMSRVTAIISALVICIIVCLKAALHRYRDNAITYKAQRDKNARELKLANAAHWHADVRQRDVAALDAKYTKELADAKAELMLCVMMLPLVVIYCTSAVCQSVREATTASGVDNAASDWADTAERDYFTPESWSTAKQLEGTQKYINEQCR